MRSHFYCSTPRCPRQWKNVLRRRCATCGSENTRLTRVPTGVAAAVIPDFPEHWNISLGRVVKSRQHLKQLQRELGVQDYEPTRGSAASILSQDNMRRRNAVRVSFGV